jgi:hypothetical protein
MTRIKGPKGGPRPVGHKGPIAEVGGSSGVDRIAPAEAPAVSGASNSGALDQVGQVAARLRAGEIDVDRAIELLIDDAVARQIGAATERASDLERELRALLRGYAASDPFLAARIRRLTVDK